MLEEEIIEPIQRQNKNTFAKLLQVAEPLLFMFFFFLFLFLMLIIVYIGYEAYKNNIVEPDLIVYNATIWTAAVTATAANSPMTAFAVKNGVIIETGTTADLLTKYSKFTNQLPSNVKLVNANNSFVMPGFVDSHVHLLQAGKYLFGAQMRTVASKVEFRDVLQEYMTNQQVKSGSWVTGGEWNHELWGGELPTKEWIDDMTPDNPVFLVRADGHMGLCNSKCLQLVNITSDTEAPEGGEIVKDDNGQPTGLLKDNAAEMVIAVIPTVPEEDDKALQLAMDYVLKYGVTSVHEMGNWNSFAALNRSRHIYNNMKIRVHEAVPLLEWKGLAELIQDNRGHKGDEWLSYGAVKAFVDGSLGSHTALQFEPYIDDGSYGIFVTPQNVLSVNIKDASFNGIQCSIHAIGDRANAVVLDILDDLSEAKGADWVRSQRFRVEHAQQIRQSDLTRFDKYQVIASMQPAHLLDDGLWAHKLIGDRQLSDLYRIESLYNRTTVAFGSDWYVSLPNPLEGIYAAVTRQVSTGQPAFFAEERITVEEALRAYTVNAAYASFKEHSIGQIKAGFLADFIMLDKNLLALEDQEQIRTTQVIGTFVGGKQMY